MKKVFLLGLTIVLLFVSCNPIEDEKENKEPLVVMNQVPVPDGGVTFPINVDDSGSEVIKYTYMISETELDYPLWEKVYYWAINNGYKFQNPGRNGGDKSVENNMPSTPVAGADEVHPVTQISWRDAVVFCNALTEYENSEQKSKSKKAKRPCYYGNKLLSKSKVLRDSTVKGMDVFLDDKAFGYRLPSKVEWECAARWIGPRKLNKNVVEKKALNGVDFYWTKGNSTSGAFGTTDVIAAGFANFNTEKTVVVKGLAYNGLKLYDMSGNVAEFCFDKDSKDVKKRVLKGGSFVNENRTGVAIGAESSIAEDAKEDYVGIRLVTIWNNSKK